MHDFGVTLNMHKSCWTSTVPNFETLCQRIVCIPKSTSMVCLGTLFGVVGEAVVPVFYLLPLRCFFQWYLQLVLWIQFLLALYQHFRRCTLQFGESFMFKVIEIGRRIGSTKHAVNIKRFRWIFHFKTP